MENDVLKMKLKVYLGNDYIKRLQKLTKNLRELEILKTTLNLKNVFYKM